jgi:hypothetical protein
MTLGVQAVEGSNRDLSVALGIDFPSSEVSSAGLFAALGLGTTTALDVSAYEGAEVIFDLNSEELPADQIHRYGLVFNGGTLEHVFHVPNALTNMTRLLQSGGCILHVLPLHNWVDHGFYQFSPTLMFDYYAAAGFDALESAIAAFDPHGGDGGAWEITAAPPGALGNGSATALDQRAYFLLVLVRATNQLVERPLPIQSTYARATLRRFNPPRWFAPFELQGGKRSNRKNVLSTPLLHFEHEIGRSWVCHVPDLVSWSDSMDTPLRSPLIILQDERPLGPCHAPHDRIREFGGGAYSHWGPSIYLSTPDGSNPNENGCRYVAVLAGTEP